MRKPTTYRIRPATVPHLTDADIELKARTLRDEYATKCGPIKFPLDVEDIIWSLLQHRDNLTLEDPDDLGVDQNGVRVIGYTAGDYQGGAIQVDISIVNTPLYWLTVAHEEGHWMLHRHLLAEAYAQAKAEGARGIPTLERNVTFEGQFSLPPEEWQANRFAVHLMMPEDVVRAVFRVRISG